MVCILQWLLPQVYCFNNSGATFGILAIHFYRPPNVMAIRFSVDGTQAVGNCNGLYLWEYRCWPERIEPMTHIYAIAI